MIATPEALELAESAPQAVPAQPGPERLQFTPFARESLPTVAVKLADLPVWTVAVGGDTPTDTGAERVIAGSDSWRVEQVRSCSPGQAQGDRGRLGSDQLEAAGPDFAHEAANTINEGAAGRGGLLRLLRGLRRCGGSR